MDGLYVQWLLHGRQFTCFDTVLTLFFCIYEDITTAVLCISAKFTTLALAFVVGPAHMDAPVLQINFEHICLVE